MALTHKLESRLPHVRALCDAANPRILTTMAKFVDCPQCLEMLAAQEPPEQQSRTAMPREGGQSNRTGVKALGGEP